MQQNDSRYRKSRLEFPVGNFIFLTINKGGKENQLLCLGNVFFFFHFFQHKFVLKGHLFRDDPYNQSLGQASGPSEDFKNYPTRSGYCLLTWSMAGRF